MCSKGACRVTDRDMAKEDRKNIRLLITGGGTGGHLFPAVAAAQCLLKSAPESEVLFVGTRRKMDKTTLEQYGFRTESIISYGLKGKSFLELVKALLVLPVSCLQAAFILLRFRPDVVMGVGGYVTGPVVATAKLFGKPTLIHEQNSIPGLANRKLGALVRRVCLSLPDSGGRFDEKKTVFTGNPVRQELLELKKKSKESSERKRKFTIAVLGGSQGAHGVNCLVTETLTACMQGSIDEYCIIHQTGDKDSEWVKKKYEEAGVNAEVAPFFRDMADVYSRADLVLSRAGATTLSELSVLGKPAILFPYPHAADNHQEKNADYYVQGGGAVKFDEKAVQPTELAVVITDYMNTKGKLMQMSASMENLGFSDAPERIVDVCYSLLHETDK